MALALYQIVYWISRVVLGVLSLRLVLRFFSANPVAPVVSWIYDVTSWMLQPVDFIFPNIVVGSGVFDVVALIGIVFYAIVFMVIRRIIDIFLRGPSSII